MYRKVYRTVQLAVAFIWYYGSHIRWILIFGPRIFSRQDTSVKVHPITSLDPKTAAECCFGNYIKSHFIRDLKPNSSFRITDVDAKKSDCLSAQDENHSSLKSGSLDMLSERHIDYTVIRYGYTFLKILNEFSLHCIPVICLGTNV